MLDLWLFLFQGVSYDHVEMNFFLNGKPLNTPFLGIKGTVFPIFYGVYNFHSGCSLQLGFIISMAPLHM